MRRGGIEDINCNAPSVRIRARLGTAIERGVSKYYVLYGHGSLLLLPTPRRRLRPAAIKRPSSSIVKFQVRRGLNSRDDGQAFRIIHSCPVGLAASR